MVNYDEIDKAALNLPLNDKFYNLGTDEIAFYKSITGIATDEDLKQHIISVQQEAYAVFPYPCIRWFAFARQALITQQQVYPDFLKLGRERPGAIYLEMACCFGADVRKAVADGYPAGNCIATDLRPEFWNLGYKLFKDSPEKFPVPFLAGDALNSSFLELTPAKLASASTTPSPKPSEVETLSALAGHVSAIHATNFFHLFEEPTQLTLARLFAGLLDPRPGSMIFGSHVGRAEKGILKWRGDSAWPMFCHCPESWKEMWKEAFGDIPVWVEATVVEYPNFPDVKLEGAMKLMWSVTRV